MNKPLSALCIDIETADADTSYVDRAMADWKPPANIKDSAKIDARYLEAVAKIADKAALMDGAPIICVALHHGELTHCFHRLDVETDFLSAAQSDKQMLSELRAYLNEATSAGTELVGHNLLGFDLPKLRLAYLRHSLALPLCLQPPTPQRRQPVFDLMREFRYFSAEHHDERYVSLKTVLDTLGIERPDDIDGADVPKAYREGRHDKILEHARLDVELTMRAYKMMMGQV